jgi:hypothetical protein
MQYTATSFAQPVARILQPVLHTVTTPISPRPARWASETADRALVSFYFPLIAAIDRAGQRLRGSHQARVTGSLLYIGATVLVVLALLFLPGTRR